MRQQNPLGKIPVLVLDDGSAIFNSPRHPRISRSPSPAAARSSRRSSRRASRAALQALADGIIDASILIVYEGRYRPAEKHEQKWLDLQQGKVDRALAALEASPPGLDAPPDVGQITLACALGYREFPLPGHLARRTARG